MLAAWLAGRLNLLALGDDVARGLGVRLATTRIVTAVAVIVLAGTATSLAGPIALLGLAVAHAARGLVGGDYRWIMPLAGVLGAIVLLAADVIGRVVVAPAELEAGIVAAIVGRAGADRPRSPHEGDDAVSAAPLVLPGGPGEPVADVAVRVAAARARRHRRTVGVLAVAAAVALAAATASLLLGAAGLGFGDVLAVLAGQGSPKADFVILRLRLPRVLAAIIAGTALGLGGALFQTTLRNPLASPDILGVTGGASLAAVGSMLLLGLEGPAVSLAAFAGALAVAALMWGLAWRDGLTGIRFVLVGIGLGVDRVGPARLAHHAGRGARGIRGARVDGRRHRVDRLARARHRRRGGRRAARAHRGVLAPDAAARALRRRRTVARARRHPRPRHGDRPRRRARRRGHRARGADRLRRARGRARSPGPS